MAREKRTVVTPLREEREKRGWTLDFLHACLCALIEDRHKIPISLRQLESWERGEHLPHPYWRQKLCTVYQKSALDLGLVRQTSPQKEAFSPRDERSARRIYLQRIAERYGVIQLPIGPVQGFSLQAVFQPLRLVQAPPGDQYGFPELGSSQAGKRPKMPGENQADSFSLPPASDNEPLIAENGNEALKMSVSRRILVLGGPGTGKSTLLKYFVGSRAQEALQNEQAPFPVFISLPELGKSQKTVKSYLLAMLQDMLIEDAFLEVLWEKIQHGQAFLCLDSLDEVVTDQANMIQKINAFVSSLHPQATCVISSRFTDFKRGQFLSSRVVEWELLPLDYSRGQLLAQRLLPELQQRMLQAGTPDPRTFLKNLEMHPRIAAWGKNPLLLSLAAILYVRQGRLPESRQELYLQVIDTIIEMREARLEWRLTLREVVGALAYKLFTEQKGSTFSITDLIFLLRQIRQERGESWLVEDIARLVRNVGLIEAVGQGNFRFLHQTFQEYLAGYSVALLPPARADREMNRLVEQIHAPFCRQILIELAHVVNQENSPLEYTLYQKIIRQYQQAKMGLLADQNSEQLPLHSALSEGCDSVLQAVVDIWDTHYCTTLEAGSPDRKEDGELASSLAWIFERNPRPVAVPALVVGLSLYQKKARFIGALGEVGTDEAKEALYLFTVEQLAHCTDPPLLRYLASALGQARVEQAIPSLQEIKDRQDFDIETRFEAHHALRLMGQESVFDEQSYYQIERIVQALTLEDEQHRPSDWRRVVKMAHWLQTNYQRTQALHVHYLAILRALEQTLDHVMSSARQVTVSALGELGNSSTFTLLLGRLENHAEQAYDVAHLMLEALERLVLRQQVDITREQWGQSCTTIQHHYPALGEEIARTQMHVQIILEEISPKEAE